MSDPTPPSDSQPAESSRPPKTKWFHFRWRVLLVLPAALLVLCAFYGPRQYNQRRVLAAMKEVNAVVRTQPISVPGVERLVGPEYSQEIIEVYLRNPDLKDDDLKVLAGLPTLQKLELAGSRVTSEGMSNLQDLPNLYTLHLSDTEVGDAGLAHLHTFRNLGILSLNNTPISDAGLGEVGRIQSLERLYLNGTEITDEGLKHLGELGNLKELACINTGLTDACLVHLHGLKNLELLKVYNTNITREALVDLQKVLPKCNIWEPDAGQ